MVEATPTDQILPPQPSGAFALDESVKKSFPVLEARVLRAQSYGESLWGRTAKIQVELPSGQRDTYFLKLDETGQNMCEGEFESLKEIWGVSAIFVPQPYAWGTYIQQNSGSRIYFLLTEFRDVGEQVRTIRSILYSVHVAHPCIVTTVSLSCL